MSVTQAADESSPTSIIKVPLGNLPVARRHDVVAGIACTGGANFIADSATIDRGQFTAQP